MPSVPLSDKRGRRKYIGYGRSYEQCPGSETALREPWNDSGELHDCEVRVCEESRLGFTRLSKSTR
jgi:hypothetical protein